MLLFSFRHFSAEDKVKNFLRNYRNMNILLRIIPIIITVSISTLKLTPVRGQELTEKSLIESVPIEIEEYNPEIEHQPQNSETSPLNTNETQLKKPLTEAIPIEIEEYKAKNDNQPENSPKYLLNPNETQLEIPLTEAIPMQIEEHIAQTDDQPQNSGASPLNPNESQLRLPLFSQDEQDFNFGFGSLMPNNTALKGATRDRVNFSRSSYEEIFPVGIFLQQKLSNNQRILFEGVGDPKFLGLDLSYSTLPENLPGAVSFNLSTLRGIATTYKGGEKTVELANDAEPWLIRTGGGVEYTQLLNPNLNLAVAGNYQRISSRDGMFSSKVIPTDELGNPLTVSSIGQDDLVTLSFSGLYTTVDQPEYPTQGQKIRFGMEQALPIGLGNIVYNQLNVNFSQFLPINLLGKNENTDIFVFNFQGGTFLGDVPPYEAYNLGGSNSIRGYNRAEVTSSRTAIQTTVEYRSPIFLSFDILEQEIDLRGITFFDYGTDLGSQYTVIGRPAQVRNKPGWGLGYGLGVHFITPVGLFRLETGWNNEGGNTSYFLVGDRF